MPPAGYGGIEWVVQQLCDGLVERGHDVTLYATGDSHTAARLRCIYERQQPERMHQTAFEARHAAFALADQADFEVIHDHTGFCVLAAGQFLATPLVHTVHCAFDDVTIPFYRQFREAAAFVSISDYQRTLAPQGMRWAATVYNAVDVPTWPYRADKQDYLLAFGRVCEAKGFHVAIEVARRTGHRLVMAGVVQPAYREYFERVVAPELDDQITYLGEVDDTRKRELFAGARGFLFPVLWPEPFGLVMLEALATGTPVVALRDGAVEEVVDHGSTGFVCEDVEDMIAAVGRLHEIDAAVCRSTVEERFSVERMLSCYERVYRSVLSGASAQPG